MLFALCLFLATYILLIALPSWRTWIALASAAVFILAGVLSPWEALGAIDFNVLLMLCGTMGTVSLFIRSGMPSRMADTLMRHTPDAKWLIVAIALFAGVISAFIDNVATVLMVAPVGLAIAKKLKFSPVPMIICIAVSSNLQGAATLVGDTTSILLGGYAQMDFLDFIVRKGKPSIFWAVELGAMVTIPVMLWLFRDSKGEIVLSKRTVVNNKAPSLLLVLNIALLIGASFLPVKPAMTNGLICMAVFGVALIDAFAREGLAPVKCAFSEIDLHTVGMLAGLFIVIQGISVAGVIQAISDLFMRIGGNSVFGMYTLLVFGSVLFSAFIDNIPYVATMLPVVSGIAAQMGCPPELLYFGLLSGATLGGNLTPIGASANIAACGILRKEGYTVSNREFMRIGVPFTFAAVLSAYAFIYFTWG